MNLKITAVASGVVEGEHGTRGNAVPPNIFWNTVPPYDVRTKGNGDTLSFPQIGLQKCKVYGKS